MNAVSMDADPTEQPRRAPRSRLILTVAMAFLAIVFAGLGTWQVKRLVWKLDIIERVEARVNGPPADAPSSPTRVTAESDEYRRVTATGVFRHDKEVQVQAVTALGAGFWVITPLVRKDGTSVLVNRGFVPTDRRDPSSRVIGATGAPVRVTGLIRMPEPGGAFLRRNDPANGRWYSRDVAAIAAVNDMPLATDYFIDADATPNPGGWPVGGLTVTRFRNNHLVYALTWYALAIMSFAAAGAVRRGIFR
ncbi:SURF1 family protein [Pararhizobium gei]|uniref:SURF1 family protein n=1 Tax=Pararhizobium gei TaxID=1395951 RepID=UPI0023D99AEC|nr:SURF1 family protein [Rhizobium gei]